MLRYLINECNNNKVCLPLRDTDSTVPVNAGSEERAGVGSWTEYIFPSQRLPEYKQGPTVVLLYYLFYNAVTQENTEKSITQNHPLIGPEIIKLQCVQKTNFHDSFQAILDVICEK